MRQSTKNELEALSKAYEEQILGMEGKAKISIEGEGRAYGGFIRSAKGELQEFIAEQLVIIAWCNELGGDLKRILINKDKIQIPMKVKYVSGIRSVRVRDYLSNDLSSFKYGLSVDKHVFVDKKLVIAIESKAYTENAMIKRILVDFMLLKIEFPKLKSYLVQMESMLGGDYELAQSEPLGSRSTHAIMSYFESVDLVILTLMKGKREVHKPINKREFFKPLEMSALEEGVHLLANDLKGYL